MYSVILIDSLQARKYVHILKVGIFSDTTPEPMGESFLDNSPITSRNQTICEKLKPNWILQTILFNMMYNVFMLRHRFSNEWWGGVP